MSNNKKIKDLFDIIPGKVKVHLTVNSMFPKQLINFLELSREADSVILLHEDVSRYHEDPMLVDYISNDRRCIYNVTMGYDNYQRLDNYFILSYPHFYFIRQPNQFNQHQNLPYGFSSLNNRAALHRLILGYKLHRHNLLKEMIFSQNLYMMINGGFDELYLEKLDNFHEYKNMLPITQDKSVEDHWVDYHVSHDAYNLAYCNIATESETEFFEDGRPPVPTPVTTEKTFKPFTSGQVPIWLAPPGHINYLKSLGFECMENLLPTDYDSMNTFDKIDSIVNVVAKGKDYIEDFYHDHIKEIKHNHQLIHSDIVDNLIIQRIKDLIL